MVTKLAKLSQNEVLRYQPGRRSHGTVRRHYQQLRSEQKPPVPMRCDAPSCMYHYEALTWNGLELKMILDHKNGVNGDNRPENLQFLCPNCNSQKSDHGGGNKGKVIQSDGGFAHVRNDGKKDYTLPAESGIYNYSGNSVNLKHKKNA